MKEWPLTLAWWIDARGAAIVTTDGAPRYFSDPWAAARVVDDLTRPELRGEPAGNC